MADRLRVQGGGACQQHLHGSQCRHAYEFKGAVGTAFGCTLQGDVAESEVLHLMQALLDAGADRVSLADTVGSADPALVYRLFDKSRALVGERLWCAHFHDTRGMGLFNTYAAWQTGVARFDACLAGIGGCPHASGASGNVMTEDLVFMLERMGVATGIDVAALLALRQRVAGWWSGVTLHGTLWQAVRPAPVRCHGPLNPVSLLP